MNSSVGVSVDDSNVILDSTALNGKTGTISISGGDYKLSLAANVDTLQDTLDGWHAVDSNLAYFEGRRGDYFSLSDDSLSVTYYASIAGDNKVELSGVTGSPIVDGTTVKLTENNFNGNTVSVVSNDGNYKFSLSGDLKDKTFTGSAEADTIENGGQSLAIDAGGGNDSIVNSGSNVSINGGLGNDLITLSGGTNSSVNVTLGDDTINVGSAITEFTVIGFNTGDVLNFASDVTAATYDSGTLKVTAGDKNINVKNATAPANRTETWLSFTGPAAIYGKTSGNDYLTNAKQITYGTADAETYFTLSGINDTAGVEVSVVDEKVTVNEAALNMNATSTYTVNLSGGNYTLDFKGTTTSNQVAETLTGSGAITATLQHMFPHISQAPIKLTPSNPPPLPRPLQSAASTGVTLADNITVDNTTVKIFNSALAQKTVSLSTTDGYTLALGNDVTLSSSSSSSDWSGYRYGTTYSTSAGYTLSGNTISYTSASSNFSTLFTLSGVTSTSEINVNNSAKTVTLTANNLGTNDITISGNNGYKLALADTVTQTQTVANAASLINGKYTSATYAEWYELGTKITYHAATEPKIFTLDGLSKAAKLNENVIVTDGDTTTFEFKAAALNKSDVTITGGKFSVKLNSDVDTTAEPIAESKTFSDGTLTYTSAGTGEYYAASNSGVKYTARQGCEQFTLSGIKSLDGVTIDAGTVTVDNDALDTTSTEPYSVKLDGNFNLKLSGVNTSPVEVVATILTLTHHLTRKLISRSAATNILSTPPPLPRPLLSAA